MEFIHRRASWSRALHRRGLITSNTEGASLLLPAPLLLPSLINFPTPTRARIVDVHLPAEKERLRPAETFYTGNLPFLKKRPRPPSCSMAQLWCRDIPRDPAAKDDSSSCRRGGALLNNEQY